MTAPVPHGPGFGRHEPSVKHTNAHAATSFTIYCTMAFLSSCCSLVLFFEEPSCDQSDGFSVVLTNEF